MCSYKEKCMHTVLWCVCVFNVCIIIIHEIIHLRGGFVPELSFTRLKTSEAAFSGFMCMWLQPKQQLRSQWLLFFQT